VSENSREGFCGKATIETISRQLQTELPGLRGFSAANIKFMRQFYEIWSVDLKSLTAVSEIDILQSDFLYLMSQQMKKITFFAL